MPEKINSAEKMMAYIKGIKDSAYLLYTGARYSYALSSLQENLRHRCYYAAKVMGEDEVFVVAELDPNEFNEVLSIFYDQPNAVIEICKSAQQQ